MYRHIHNVAALIDDAYCLLVGVSGRHSDKSPELAYAEVHMHDEVARLHFLKLFHSESHLAGARRVAAQAVLVEAVEYLMVGEEACAQVVVGEALVQCPVHRFELYVIVTRLYLVAVEDVAQTLCLFLAVGKDIEFVAHKTVVFERTGEKVEVFVEKRLRSDVERDGGIRRARGVMAYLYAAEG